MSQLPHDQLFALIVCLLCSWLSTKCLKWALINYVLASSPFYRE